ncbi:DUF4145 domain-containing protein [Elizabethkingia anophelis]|uniref:DUF4145 domain-containing protein n=1 Tax=Elizabethkingia anophelis TaxID=1117645 RepID=UPI000B360B88|nr:DUF4145 domain-containing protein [Elizabethkingia anophelis]
MNCPHCNKAVRFDWVYKGPIKIIDNEKAYFLFYDTCPNCEDSVIYYSLCNYKKENTYNYYIRENTDGSYCIESEILLFPNKRQFEYIDSIPEKYLEDYNEAKEVISISPKASAALSRRLLQLILRDEFKIKEKSLSQEIGKFVLLPGIPSHLTDAVDAIRNIGNLAAHPEKESNTGNIVNIEPGEAEWLIEVIEALFDFTFIQPYKLEIRRKELNEKLNAIGKPNIK